MPYSLRFAVPPMGQEQLLAAGMVPGQQTGQNSQQPGTPPPQPNQVETVYVTMSTTDPERHVRWNWRNMMDMVVRCLAVVLLLVFVLVPEMPVYTVRALVVPAVLLPVQTITVSVPIAATGVKSYPATQAHGSLTISNGGSLTESLQAGFLLTTSSGVEVATDQGVTIPPGNGQSYGVATVSAHAVMAGSSGNIPAGSVDRTYGMDIFIRNLSAFSGGADAYAVRYETNQDKQAALATASVQAEAKKPLELLLKPCSEITSQQSSQVSITLRCQPVTYRVPAGMQLQIVGVRVEGRKVVVRYRAVRDADM